MTRLNTLARWWDRTLPTLPDSSLPATGQGAPGTSLANLALIVGLALVITLLARALAPGRGNRRK